MKPTPSRTRQVRIECSEPTMPGTPFMMSSQAIASARSTISLASCVEMPIAISLPHPESHRGYRLRGRERRDGRGRHEPRASIANVTAVRARRLRTRRTLGSVALEHGQEDDVVKRRVSGISAFAPVALAVLLLSGCTSAPASTQSMAFGTGGTLCDLPAIATTFAAGSKIRMTALLAGTDERDRPPDQGRVGARLVVSRSSRRQQLRRLRAGPAPRWSLQDVGDDRPGLADARADRGVRRHVVNRGARRM